MEITRIISSADDGAETCKIDISRYELDALVRIAEKIMPGYSDYAQPYSDRSAEKGVLMSLLSSARCVDITPNKR